MDGDLSTGTWVAMAEVASEGAQDQYPNVADEFVEEEELEHYFLRLVRSSGGAA